MQDLTFCDDKNFVLFRETYAKKEEKRSYITAANIFRL